MKETVKGDKGALNSRENMFLPQPAKKQLNRVGRYVGVSCVCVRSLACCQAMCVYPLYANLHCPTRLFIQEEPECGNKSV